MLDFFTQNDAPVEITIDGKPYKLQRFLLADMIEYSASERRKIMEQATEKMSIDDKARFITYWQPPAIDLMDMARWCLSPEGVKLVAEDRMQKAGVPDDVRTKLLDTRKMYELVAELTTAPRAIAQMKGDGEESPLTSPPAGSGDSGAAQPTTNTTSDKPTQGSNQAA